jgi:hypothetical protein
MDRFFQAVQRPEIDLFYRPPPPPTGGPCDTQSRDAKCVLPHCDTQSRGAKLASYRAIGRIIAKCVLEGIHIAVEFSAAVHHFLVGDCQLADSADDLLHHLAAYDWARANQLRGIYGLTHGSGRTHRMVVGGLRGNPADQTPLTDANKGAAVSDLVREVLIETRRCALEAMHSGFQVGVCVCACASSH